MALEVYPDDPLPQIGWEGSYAFDGEVSDGYKSGAEYVNVVRERDLYAVRLVYGQDGDEFDVDALNIVINFVRRHRGRGKKFAYFDIQCMDLAPVGVACEDVFVGVGNASRTAWDLPSKDATSYTLTVGGVALVDVTDYAVTLGGASDGSGGDAVVITAAPAAGKRILWSFTGRRKIVSRFDAWVLQKKHDINTLMTSGVAMHEVLG